MVNKVEAEITALQADFAHTVAWLRGDYLPSPLPKVVEDRLASLAARFDGLRDMVEEREATAAFAATRDQESVPDAIVGRLIDGENPIRVWREHRGLSLRTLAVQAGTSPSVLSDMETRKSEGRPAILRRIAGILEVSLDELIPAAEREAADAG
jgi:ribosome-binding protein aMBF1 (putative translation factor)